LKPIMETSSRAAAMDASGILHEQNPHSRILLCVL